MNIREAVLRYVGDYGWAVFPVVHGGKQPATRHGVNDATRDLEILYRWFPLKAGKPCGIAAATGRRSGFWVLDIDGETGRKSLDELLRQRHEERLATKCCRTGGGGQHFYFAMPPGHEIGNRAAVAPGIDVRGDGGYVVIPPSIHPSGNAYMWDENAVADIRPAPEWLVELVERRGNTARDDAASRTIEARLPDAPTHSCYVQSALEKELKAVASASPGHRNDALNKASFSLGQLIGAQELDRTTTEAALIVAATSAGLARAEILSTMASGIEAGIRTPRAPRGTLKPLSQPAATATATSAPVTEPAAEAAINPDVLLTAVLSDKGNAECLAHLFGDALRFDHTNRRWRVWSGAHWQFDLDGEAERLATCTVRARRATAALQVKPDIGAIRYHLRSENQGGLKALLASAQVLDRFSTTITQYDVNPFLACSGDITLDLLTCTARPPSHEDYITLKFGAVYDKRADCPRWRQFMREVFAGDEQIIAYIQRAVGYSLTGSTKEQKCWVCIGNGANGKSLFLGILHKLLGDYAGSTSWDTFDAATSEARGDLAKLRGCRIVTVIESNDDARLNEARIKNVTGSDKVTARALYANSFDYIPTYKIWFATNNRPRIVGTDNGIWRRIQLIPFNVSFDGPQRDVNLEEKLTTELSGILNWALEGLAEWHRQGLNAPASITAATEEYRIDSDVVGQWIEQCCMKGEAFEMTGGSGYDAYKVWCEAGGLRPLSVVNWAHKLKERGYEKSYNTRHQAIYCGLSLLAAR